LHVNLKSQKTQKKGDSLNQPYSNAQRFLTLKFGHGGGLSQAHLFVRSNYSETDQIRARQCEISKNSKKGRSTKSAVTPTHNAFERSNLDTVAVSARRIFLRERVVQGRVQISQCEN